MKNKEIVQIAEGLSRLSDIKFPAKVTFNITRALKILSPIVDDIMSVRSSILLTHGTEDKEHPGFYYVEDEGAKKELEELDEVENQISLPKISLQDIESIELSIQDMTALYPLLEEV